MASVLIVDDHSDIRRLLAITLGREFELIEADNGEAALAAVQRHMPRAVLLDVMMPGEMDGFQVLEAIKSHPIMKTTKVAMVTARGQASDAAEARKRGADAYFVKPFSPLQVVEWIRSNT